MIKAPNLLVPAAFFGAFTCGVTALSLSMMLLVERGSPSPIADAAPFMLAAANCIIAYITLGTLWLPAAGAGTTDSTAAQFRVCVTSHQRKIP